MYQFREPPVPFSLPYKGQRLEWAIEVIGWTKGHLADRMDLNRGSLGQMLANHRRIPDIMAIWIESLAQFHLTFPKPLGWAEKPPRHTDSEINAA